MSELTSAPPATLAAPETPERKWTFFQIIIAAFVGIIAAIAALFVFSLFLAATNPQGAASFMGYVRDVFISILCLQSIVIVAGVGILVVQIARFVNLMRNETKPVTDQARETLQTVQTSTRFIGTSAAEPFVAARSWWAGLRTFTSLVVSVQAVRVLFRKREDNDATSS